MAVAILTGLAIVTYCTGKTGAFIFVSIVNCFVPDELPFVDEIIEIILVIKQLKKSRDAKNGNKSCISTHKKVGNNHAGNNGTDIIAERHNNVTSIDNMQLLHNFSKKG